MRGLALGSAAAAVVFLVVAIFNAVVDPYGFVRWVDTPGFNHRKPALKTRVRLVKAVDVRRLRPAAIVLGSSRSHIALRMSHPGWRDAPRYNLAFDNASPREMYAYLRHAYALRPLKTVVLGLDSDQIKGANSWLAPDFNRHLLLDPQRPWTKLRADLAKPMLLLSMDTLAASIRTLESQGGVQRDWFAPDGQRLGPEFFHRSTEEYVTKGPAAYFWEIDRKEFSYKTLQPPAPELEPQNGRTPPGSFGYIRRIVAFCRDHGIALRIYITPSHAHQMEISALTQESAAIEQGKRSLVALLAQDAAKARAAPYPLWDFSGYSSVTTEPVTADRHEMRYYWDSSHFKEEVGDWVLDRLFSTVRAGHEPPADFGRRLTPQTVEAELAEIRQGHLDYVRSHPADIATLRTMLDDERVRRAAHPSE
jgi:hypothetical protein